MGTIALASVQPCSPAWISAYMTATSPPLDATMPTTSNPGRSGLRDCGTSRTTATKPIRVIGTLMRKTQPHQALARIQPPTSGPSGSARKLAAAQIPIARGRSASEKSTVTMANDMTVTAAPARPSSVRIAMNVAGEVA